MQRQVLLTGHTCCVAPVLFGALNIPKEIVGVLLSNTRDTGPCWSLIDTLPASFQTQQGQNPRLSRNEGTFALRLSSRIGASLLASEHREDPGDLRASGPGQYPAATTAS